MNACKECVKGNMSCHKFKCCYLKLVILVDNSAVFVIVTGKGKKTKQHWLRRKRDLWKSGLSSGLGKMYPSYLLRYKCSRKLTVSTIIRVIDPTSSWVKGK